MRLAIMITVLLALAGATRAFDLGTEAGPKPVVDVPINVPGDRQGGDTILDAMPITIPGEDTGSTAGYGDDYDEVCPYTGSTSPDVVYTVTPAVDVVVDVDMLGSTFDTKIYVYDDELNLLACNDDYYADYVSRIEELALVGGTDHYIVVDGYGGDFGDYVITISAFEPCEITHWPWFVDEGEPPLTIDYEDTWNGGCNTDPENPPFQPGHGHAIDGVSGFYLYQGSSRRDTDWFEFVLPQDGYPVYAEAEVESYLFELGPADCGSVDVVQSVVIEECSEGTLWLTGTPGSTVWLWFGPTTFSAPDGSDVYEYDYWIHFGWFPSATENQSWSEIKALFR
ncbi:hypothetical protein GF314_08580 [bacterium]|nr:hypothetical protein [bacterium]